MTIYAWIYFWALCSVPLTFVSLFMPIPYCLKYYCSVTLFVTLCDTSSFILLFSRLLWLFGVFDGSIQVLGLLFYFCEKCHWNFGRDCIKFAYCLGEYGLFFFGHAVRLAGSWFPGQGLNPDPLQWKCGILTTGPPGKSP